MNICIISNRKIMYHKKWCIILILLILIPNSVFATEQIPITKSATIDKVIVDGKWSYYLEWKESSLNTISYEDGTALQLRTAHQGNFVYVFIDDTGTTQWNNSSDRATVCFDTDNSKNVVADSDDYCFVAVLSENNPITLQGGSPLSNNFRTIVNPNNFTAMASISDENDRYSTVPHPGYEFKIPTEIIGRSSDYGFYVSVYHTQSNKIYSWPQNVLVSSPLEIPSPSKWGELISPDKSIPEFQLPFIPLVIAVIFSVYLVRTKSGLFT